MASKSVEPWLRLLPADPRPWLLESVEPAARWVMLTRLLDREGDDPEAKKAKEASLADLGLGAGDHPRIERFLDQLLAHQDDRLVRLTALAAKPLS
jgi:hypothetical protein